MSTSTIVTLIGSTATAVATVILAVLTGKYVKLTHALVEETQSAKFPNVFVDIEFDSYDVKFIVGNAGSSPALDVRFTVQDSVPWRQIENFPCGIASLSIVQHGISYLAPGRILKFLAGYVQHDIDFFASGNTIEVGLTFSTETGKTVSRQFSIDLHSYSGVLYESFIAPEREVAIAIRDAESHRSSLNPVKNIISSFSKKSCPSCGERIASSAKKCPKCHEFIHVEADAQINSSQETPLK